MMTMPTQAAPTSEEQVCLLTYARSHDAQTFAIEAKLPGAELLNLRRTLDLLVEMGTLAIHRLDTPLRQVTGLEALLRVLRRDLGELPVDAAEASAKHPCTPTPKP